MTSYCDDPGIPHITIRAEGMIDAGVTCCLDASRAITIAGLVPEVIEGGRAFWSGDLLLKALNASPCTDFHAVATAIVIDNRSENAKADSELEILGTICVSTEASENDPTKRLEFNLEPDATQMQIDEVLKLSERHCLVLHAIRIPHEVEVWTGVG